MKRTDNLKSMRTSDALIAHYFTMLKRTPHSTGERGPKTSTPRVIPTAIRRPPPSVIGVGFLSLILSGVSTPPLAQGKNPNDQPTTVPGSNPAPRTVSIEEAVGLALANSKTLRVSAEAVNKLRGFVNERRAAGNPTLGAQIDIQHLNEGASTTFQGANGQPITVPIIKQDQKSIGIQASMPIDLLGQIRAAVSAAQFNVIAARLDYNRARNQLSLDVKNGYYDVLRAKAFVLVAEQAAKNSQDRESTSQSYLRAGTGTRFDVLRAQTDVANAQQNLISARNKVDLSVASLNNLLGLDQNTPLDVKESMEATTSKEFNDSVAEAYQTRPEILQAEAQLHAAEKGFKVARLGSLQPLTLSWTYSYTPDAGGFAPRTTSWIALARVQIAIFDGGLSRARMQESKADVNTARLNRQIAMDSIALDVRQAYLGLLEARDRLNVTTAALIQAREQYRLAQVRFKEGVTQVPGASPLLEISDAQTALTQAQSNHVNAQYDLQNASARLDRAVGRYAFDGSAKPGMPTPTLGK